VLTFRWVTEQSVIRTETNQRGQEVKIEEKVREDHARVVNLSSSDLDVKLHSDLRRKGLAWYSLYDVNFDALVDHLSVESAFLLSSLVSVFLVVSYLHLVVSARFAYVEAGFAQLVYLVGFSLAHFWEGYTGLTITVLAIVTLFVLMQLTGRVRWSEVLGSRGQPSSALPSKA
jgi:hypothetical protein